ncbi:MAG: hypothetical protein COV99_02475 [Bacteroidetes bacterium CG12_big_fil_rev_8_21_14_0_65_60_17]|nr:MAG: hypothetical protein COV99_02475 [Bacteroidetes bacterium CG12_big_fil_rev_8_21_14_0_65_60_17]
MSGEHIHLSDTLKLAEQFNALQVRLHGPSTDIHRLTGILLFLVDDLAHLTGAAGARPYLEELVGLFPENESRIPLDGLDPELLKDGANTLSRLLASSLLDDPERIRLSVWEHRLYAWTVFQFIRVGAQERAGTLLGDIPPPTPSESQWSEWLQHLQVHAPDWAAPFETCIHFHKPTLPVAGSSCVVPVAILSPHRTSRRTQTAGYCRGVRFVITGLTHHRDVISLHVRHGGSAEELLKKPIRAARTMLADNAPSLLRYAGIGSISMSDGQAAHAGHSAGLAISLLYFCEMNRYCNQRRQYRIDPECMMTGEVLEDGTVTPVAPDSLSPKVAAAFFSSTRLLVVPESQVQYVRRELGRLRSLYPDRHLQVRGVGSVQEALADRRIVRSRQIPLVIHSAMRIWRRKWLVAAVFAGLVLGSFGMWWSENVIVPNVTHWAHDGSAYMGLNDAGQELLRLPMTPSTRAYIVQTDQTMTPWAAVADVDGDGFGDLIALEFPDSNKGVPGGLVTMNGRTHDVTVCHCFTMDLPYPRDLTIISDWMTPKSLLVEDLNQDGRAEAYVIAMHSFYPAVLMQLDPVSARPLATYHHPGAFYTLVSDDVDGDGYDELLLGGTNNSMDRAILAVLDPRRIEGMGPGEGEYQPGDGPTFNEDAYIRLPLSGMGRVLPNAFPFIRTVRRMSSDSLIFLSSLDAMAPRSDGVLEHGSLFTWIDYDLRPVAVGTSDQYDTVWNHAYQIGLDPRPIDNQWKMDFMSGFERLTRDGWHAIPISPRSKAWSLVPVLPESDE